MKLKLTFICMTNNEEILNKNLLASKVYIDGKHQFIFSKGTNISKGYNEMMEKSVGDITCFLHQDVSLPVEWEDNFNKAINNINNKDKNWGVVGLAGAAMSEINNSHSLRGWISNNRKHWGNIGGKGLPLVVQTLDEMFLAVDTKRYKKNAFKFDEQFERHFYGADICMQHNIRGNQCYAINAYAFHNHNTKGKIRGGINEDFIHSADKFQKKYFDYLPISTTCCILRKDTNVLNKDKRGF